MNVGGTIEKMIGVIFISPRKSIQNFPCQFLLDKLLRKKMWAVWAWIRNFQRHIWVSTVGKGGAILLGFLLELNK